MADASGPMDREKQQRQWSSAAANGCQVTTGAPSIERWEGVIPRNAAGNSSHGRVQLQRCEPLQMGVAVRWSAQLSFPAEPQAQPAF